MWYLKGPKEQVKFPGLDVQGQPADKERPHLGKKKRGSWRPSLIPVFGVTPLPPPLGQQGWPGGMERNKPDLATTKNQEPSTVILA